MNILIIPEDFTKDQQVLKPIIEAMLTHLGKPAKVTVCQNPRLQGISQALNWQRIQDIIHQYSWKVQLFLLCVDRDGVEGRRTQLTRLEKQANAILPAGRCFLAENAWQEVEVWVLAGHDLPPEWEWQQVRQERDPKEVYFLPFAERRGVAQEYDEGRGTLAKEAASRYRRIRQLCPEDIATLENKLHTWLEEL